MTILLLTLQLAIDQMRHITLIKSHIPVESSSTSQQHFVAIVTHEEFVAVIWMWVVRQARFRWTFESVTFVSLTSRLFFFVAPLVDLKFKLMLIKKINCIMFKNSLDPNANPRSIQRQTCRHHSTNSKHCSHKDLE